MLDATNAAVRLAHSVKFVFDTVRKDGHPFLQLGGLYHNFDAWCTRNWLQHYSVTNGANILF
jgi:hypothetical protein